MLLMLTSVNAFAEIRSAKHPVRDRYIVRLRDPNPGNVRGHAASISSVFGGRIRFIYDAVFAGFAIEIPKAAAQAMSVHPIVESVEEVEEVYFPEDYVEPSTSYQPVTDAGLWHLDRLDERQIDDGGLDGLYAYCIATTVRAYVVDSGVRATHPEFVAGQVEAGFDATGVVGGGTPSDPCPSGRPPGGYHGTAVASVLAGRTTGVAKQTKIVPVRVFDCNGAAATDTVINGLN